MLDNCSIETISIENYEIQISRFVFMHIQVYLCRVFFLTTLDIYKDYFKGRQRRYRGCCNCCCMHIMTGDKIALVHLSLEEAATFVRQGFYNQGASYLHRVDELKNSAANIFLKLVC